MDEVELLGQLESLDAIGQPCDGFILAERSDGIGSTFVFARCVIIVGWANIGTTAKEAAAATHVGHGLHPKLGVQELGEDEFRMESGIVGCLSHLVQTPAPTLAVGLRIAP